EYLQGALLLVRRTLFNQTPVADPYSYLFAEPFNTGSGGGGQIVGSLRATDAEGDALTYALTKQPEYGTVEITPDGTYTYTPGSSYQNRDQFTFTVSDRGFNLLDPFSSRSTEVLVQVPGFDRGGVGLSNGFDVTNLTGRTLTITNIAAEEGFVGPIQGAPPVGTRVPPGGRVHFELSRYPFQGVATEATLSDLNYVLQGGDDSYPTWKVVMDSTYSPEDRVTRCDVGRCSNITGAAAPAEVFGTTSIDLIDALGTQWDYSAGDASGSEVLDMLFKLNQSTPGSVVFSYENATFENATPAGWLSSGQTIMNATPSETLKVSKTYTVGYETTKTSGWEVSASTGLSILGVLDASVALQYNVSESETRSRSYTYTQEFTALPYSYTALLVSEAPRIKMSGDLTAALADTTFVFRGVDYTYPDLSENANVVYQPRVEPYQGEPQKPDVGFVLKSADAWQDPRLPRNPTFERTFFGGPKQYSLQTKAFVGVAVALPVDWTSQSQFVSSDPSVATVDATGLLTA
ncbi:MAG: Ig-like domain-containing protein, partial [Mycobacterium sp.]